MDISPQVGFLFLRPVCSPRKVLLRLTFCCDYWKVRPLSILCFANVDARYGALAWICRRYDMLELQTLASGEMGWQKKYDSIFQTSLRCNGVH